jgi:hypothetical protein
VQGLEERGVAVTEQVPAEPAHEVGDVDTLAVVLVGERVASGGDEVHVEPCDVEQLAPSWAREARASTSRPRFLSQALPSRAFDEFSGERRDEIGVLREHLGAGDVALGRSRRWPLQTHEPGDRHVPELHLLELAPEIFQAGEEQVAHATNDFRVVRHGAALCTAVRLYEHDGTEPGFVAQGKRFDVQDGELQVCVELEEALPVDLDAEPVLEEVPCVASEVDQAMVGVLHDVSRVEPPVTSGEGDEVSVVVEVPVGAEG